MRRLLGPLLLLATPLLMGADSSIITSLMGQVPSTPEEAMTWVNVIRDAGGWGVAVIEAYVIWKLWTVNRADMEKKDDKIVGILEKSLASVNATVEQMKRDSTPQIKGGG